MAQIRILPEILSNQIAAGEVVQRPSSVVKELVENSIDAGATRITVEIEQGGKSLIRVSDNGAGLARDQALLAIERYGTSKIFTKEDLFSISTFGFRGEALPSIASVSSFCLVSRTEKTDIGTKIEISGGKLVRVSDTGAPCGTMVEVKKLFFNTPARQKFLKSQGTENSHIADAVSGMALGNPGIGFRLFLNKKLIKNFPPDQDMFSRSLAVLGADVSGKLYSFEAADRELKVFGTCSDPCVTRSSSNRIYLFVNNRLVYDRGLVAAVFQGYRGRIMKGRFPMAAIFVDLPFDQVDVNVHPSKREIKFLSPGPVFQILVMAIGNALSNARQDNSQYLPGPVSFTDNDHKAILPACPVKSLDQQSFVRQSIAANRAYSSDQDQSAVYGYGHKKNGPVPEKVEQSTIEWGKTFLNQSCESVDKDSGPELAVPTQQPGLYKAEQTLSSQGFDIDRPTIFGQVMNTYIVARKNDKLVLIDQHAAHERVVYEALKKRHGALGVQSQDYLVPQTLELNHREADLLTGIIDDLAELGIRMEPFGGTTFVIKAIPSLLEQKDIKSLVLEIVENLLETGNDFCKESWLDDCLISMACHTAIRANQKMHPREMEQLLEDLDKCDNPFHCPHGRPTMVSFDTTQMEKLFKRVV